MKWVYVLVLCVNANIDTTTICDCDISSSCDFNCCCDEQCLAADKLLFSTCINVPGLQVDTEFCTFSKLERSQYAFTSSETTSKRPLCIAVDNTNFRETFQSMAPITDSAILATALADLTPIEWPGQDSVTVDSSELIFGTILKNSVGENLRLPRPRFSKKCSLVGIGFLREHDSYCVHPTASQCVNGGWLDKATFDSITVEGVIPVVTCVPGPCAAASYSAPTCSNAVTSAKISFAITNGTISGITTVLTIENIGLASISQTITVSFLPPDTEFFSGNPGYVVGKPLRHVKVEAGDVKVAGDYKFRVMDKTICANMGDAFMDRSHVVNFGIDYSSSCLHAVDTAVTCEATQTTIYNALREQGQTRLFGAFGNVIVGSDEILWISPICSTDDCETSTTCDVGAGTFISGLHYRIYYQNTGFIQAPQKKIVAVEILWEAPVAAQVVSGKWRIHLETSVTFVDISSRPTQIFDKPPTINVELPTNFLYPFRKSEV